jgi:hypothetical protein
MPDTPFVSINQVLSLDPASRADIRRYPLRMLYYDGDVTTSQVIMSDGSAAAIRAYAGISLSFSSAAANVVKIVGYDGSGAVFEFGASITNVAGGHISKSLAMPDPGLLMPNDIALWIETTPAVPARVQVNILMRYVPPGIVMR